jgi:hypothetical protein
MESGRGEIGILGARLGFSGIYAVFKAPDRQLSAPANAKSMSDCQNSQFIVDAAASHASPNQPTCKRDFIHKIYTCAGVFIGVRHVASALCFEKLRFNCGPRAAIRPTATVFHAGWEKLQQ